MIDAAGPSFFGLDGLGFEDGHVLTCWFLLQTSPLDLSASEFEEGSADL